jgi:serine phosphatase RsbU (regulator of sigma subunit)
MRNQPIRIKLLGAFFAVALFASAILIIQHISSKNKEEAGILINKLERFKTLVLNDAKAQQDFINVDLISDRYFLTHSSLRIDAHNKWQNEMDATLEEIKEIGTAEDLILEEQVSQLGDLKFRYDNAFSKLVSSTTELGYKDYGLTGEMREIAHTLEDSFPDRISLEKLLMLRRHEKDFIIRKERKYIAKFNDLIKRISSDLSIKNDSRSRAAHTHLINYGNIFQKVAASHQKNGIHSNSGLMAEVEEIENDLILTTDDLILRTKEKAQVALNDIQFFFWLAIAIFTLTVVFLIDRLSRIFAKPILTLQQRVDQFVVSGFQSDFKLPSFEGRTDELGSLYKGFKNLGEEITIHFRNYRSKAEKRHREILTKNNKIKEQKRLLEEQKNQLSTQNKSVMDSIAYAKRLQKAIFPDKELLTEKIGNCTLYFKPKDIVSGDFYWVDETADSIYFAVADCTGHGVPGAFMSLLGYNFLNQAILDLELRETDDVLDYLNASISELLNQKQEGEGIQDGMDIALCRWIKSESNLQYSGANRPLLIVRDGQVQQYDSDRLPIGWSFNNERQPFSSKKVKLKKGDQIYIFSDGYYDQFGGENDKKFKFRRFKALLAEMDGADPISNKRLLARTLGEWMRTTDQIDDICVLGVSANHFLSMSSENYIGKRNKSDNNNNGEYPKFKVVN